MKIVRLIEVWEKGFDGRLLGHLAVADNISNLFLFSLFAAEQQQPDPDVHLSYMLSPSQQAALQPYVAEALDSDRYDYILTAHGIPPDNTQPAQRPA